MEDTFCDPWSVPISKELSTIDPHRESHGPLPARTSIWCTSIYMAIHAMVRKRKGKEKTERKKSTALNSSCSSRNNINWYPVSCPCEEELTARLIKHNRKGKKKIPVSDHLSVQRSRFVFFSWRASPPKKVGGLWARCCCSLCSLQVRKVLYKVPHILWHGR